LRSDLEAILRAIGEHPPYVLVGTSGGGYLIAGCLCASRPCSRNGLCGDAARHRRTGGPPDLLQELKCDSLENQERRDYVKIENEAWSNRHKIGDIPLTVISNDYGDA
jgi:hypothetical protein